MKNNWVAVIESVVVAVEQEDRQIGREGEWRIRGSELAAIRSACAALDEHIEKLRLGNIDINEKLLDVINERTPSAPFLPGEGGQPLLEAIRALKDVAIEAIRKTREGPEF